MREERITDIVICMSILSLFRLRRELLFKLDAYILLEKYTIQAVIPRSPLIAGIILNKKH